MKKVDRNRRPSWASLRYHQEKKIEENRGKYRSQSTRLKNWDYSQAAAYFITICTKNRQQFFGKILDGEMDLSEIGEMANKYWLEIPNHFNNVTLDQHVIMPNHMHGIIIINVETPDSGVYPRIKPGDYHENKNHHEPKQSTPKLGVATGHQTAWKPGTVGVMVNQYKRIVTINARKTNPKFAWQPRYHDHIIRNKQSLQKIQEYINNNPLKWHLDKYYESN